jgi:RNA polymerase sigma-70 factor, ECF subfamily
MKPDPENPAMEEAVRLTLAHRTLLEAIIRLHIKDATLAEDTFSEVLLAVIASWERYDPHRPFSAWVRGIARRVAMNNLRKQWREPQLLDPAAFEVIEAELEQMGSLPDLELRKRALERCLGKLPAPKRQMLKLRHYHGRSYPEIGSLLGHSVRSLYVMFNRLYKLLHGCIQREMDQP